MHAYDGTGLREIKNVAKRRYFCSHECSVTVKIDTKARHYYQSTVIVKIDAVTTIKSL